LWAVTPCNLAEAHQHIRGTSCLHLQCRRVSQSRMRQKNQAAGIKQSYLLSTPLDYRCFVWPTMEGHPLLGNGPVNTSRGNEYATIGCQVLVNLAVNTHATVKSCVFYVVCATQQYKNCVFCTWSVPRGYGSWVHICVKSTLDESPSIFTRYKPNFSSGRMLHKDYYRKISFKKISGRGSQGAGRQDELMGGQPSVVK
jgi:hypothetical protein